MDVLTNRRRTNRRGEDRRFLQRNRELEVARHMSLALFQHFKVDELVEKALTTALEVIGAEAGSVLLADPQSKALVFRHAIGEKAKLLQGTSFPWDQGLAGSVFKSGEPEIIRDARQDSRHFVEIDHTIGYETRDMIVLPLKRWEGEPIGVLEVINKREGRLDQDDLSILTIISAMAAVAIEQARLFEEAKLAEVVHRLGDIGHDVKNLLTPVKMGSGLLLNTLGDLFSAWPGISADQVEESHRVCKEVIEMMTDTGRRIEDRMREIADCVKGLSSPPQFEPCRVGDVVESVRKGLGFVAEQKGITLRLEGLDALPTIVADERRLYNLFFNLINNAIPEVKRGGSITVSGRMAPTNEAILIAVADTGKGMPPEIRESLFTARTISRKAGGTGLGTKIVKDVVDAHGGQISVESVQGKGTTFRIALPCQPAGLAMT